MQPTPTPEWQQPPRAARPQRTGLIVALAAILAVILLAGVVGGGLLYWRHTHQQGSQALPDDWATAGFVVTSDTGTPADGQLDQVGQLLVGRLGDSARYQSRPHGVLVGVPQAQRAELDRLQAAAPIRTDVSLRRVLLGPAPGTPTPGTPTPSGSASSSSASPMAGAIELPSQDGKNRYLVGPVAMTGEHVESADYKADKVNGGWLVSLTFDDAGRQALTALTTKERGNRLAVVAAGVVVTAPMVQAAIPGGAMEIAGNLGLIEAKGVAATFLLGRHPATITTGDPG